MNKNSNKGLGEKAEQLWDNTKQKTREVWDKTKDVAEDAWDKTKDATEEAVDKTKEFVNRTERRFHSEPVVIDRRKQPYVYHMED